MAKIPSNVWIEAMTLREQAVIIDHSSPGNILNMKEALELYRTSLEMRLPFINGNIEFQKVFESDLSRSEQLKLQIDEYDSTEALLKSNGSHKPDTFDYSYGHRNNPTKPKYVSSSPFVTPTYITGAMSPVSRLNPNTKEAAVVSIKPATSKQSSGNNSAYESQIQDEMLDTSPCVKWVDILIFTVLL